MAKCDLCGKGVSFGIKAFKPNVKRVKAVVGGSVKHIHVCTRCLRSGYVKRAV